MTHQLNGKSLRIGGPCFRKEPDPAWLVRYHKDFGFSAAFDPGYSDMTLMAEICSAYDDADIVIAEVPAFGKSVLGPDPDVIEQNIRSIVSQLERAETIGAICCIMHGGSVPPGGWGQHSPENFSSASVDKTVKAIRRILSEVEPKNTKLVVETESRVLPDSADIYAEIIEAVDHPAFAAHFDPVNITLDPRRFYFSGDFIRDCFKKIGRYIVSCHAKDTQMMRHSQVRFDETFAGNGDLDYRTYLSELAGIEQDAPLMIEHVNERQMGWACSYIVDQARALGIPVLHNGHGESLSR